MNDQKEVRLTEGRPEHVDEVVPLIWQTSPRFFSFLYDNRPKVRDAIIAASWKATESILSHSFSTVAYLGDKLVGVLISYEKAVKKQQEFAMKQVAAPFSDQALREHVASIQSIMLNKSPLVPADAYYVTILSVSEGAQGSGVGVKLLRHAYETAKQLGCKSVQLDTEADNPAVNFYTKAGMEVEIETRIPKYEELTTVPANYRLVKELY